jgi:hypothetical protein
VVSASGPASPLGEQPNEERYRERMAHLAHSLDSYFNGEGNPDRDTGFVVLVFPFNNHEGRCNMISNGADRKDLVVLFKELIARFEGQPEVQGERVKPSSRMADNAEYQPPVRSHEQCEADKARGINRIGP